MYPKSTDILISACKAASSENFSRLDFGLVLGKNVLTPGVIGMPSADWISLQLSEDKIQLANLYTNQEIPLTGQVLGWLEKDLLWTRRVGSDGVFNYFLYRPSLQVEIPIYPFEEVKPDLVKKRGLTPSLTEALKNTEAVYIVDPSRGVTVLVVLAQDYWGKTNENFFVSTYFLGENIYEFEDVNLLFERAGISSKNRLFGSGDMIQVAKNGLLSPNGYYTAKENGIYEIGTANKIVSIDLPELNLQEEIGYYPGIDFKPCCWRSDGRVLILSSGTYAHQTVRGFGILPRDTGYVGISFTVPLPVLQVTLPDELMIPEP